MHKILGHLTQETAPEVKAARGEETHQAAWKPPAHRTEQHKISSYKRQTIKKRTNKNKLRVYLRSWIIRRQSFPFTNFTVWTRPRTGDSEATRHKYLKNNTNIWTSSRKLHKDRGKEWTMASPGPGALPGTEFKIYPRRKYLTQIQHPRDPAMQKELKNSCPGTVSPPAEAAQASSYKHKKY